MCSFVLRSATRSSSVDVVGGHDLPRNAGMPLAVSSCEVCVVTGTPSECGSCRPSAVSRRCMRECSSRVCVCVRLTPVYRSFILIIHNHVYIPNLYPNALAFHHIYNCSSRPDASRRRTIWCTAVLTLLLVRSTVESAFLGASYGSSTPVKPLTSPARALA